MSFQLYDEKTPLGVKSTKGLHLVTENTTNGQKVQILLEELADAYGTEWTTTLLDTSTNEQKKIGSFALIQTFEPGRIPIIIDNSQSPPFPLMETSAELLYLLRLDKDHQFGFTDEIEQSELLQWLFFWHESGAPYQGNYRFFSRAEEQSNSDDDLFAINRFRKETYRVYGVLELQLSGKYTGQPKEFLAGKNKGKHSIADVGAWAWVKNWPGSGFTEEEMNAFPSLLQWIERIAKRPGVKRGIGEKYMVSR